MATHRTLWDKTKLKPFTVQLQKIKSIPSLQEQKWGMAQKGSIKDRAWFEAFLNQGDLKQHVRRVESI